jgi:hypothetical protein
MKDQVIEDSFSVWAQFRHSLENSPDALADIASFWSETKLIPFNHSVDPYNPNSWPNPWAIIDEGRYDDLTLAIMLGYTIKLTEQFKNSYVEIRILVDSTRTRLYNLVYVDNTYVLNYDRDQVVKAQDIPESFLLENLVELKRPR